MCVAKIWLVCLWLGELCAWVSRQKEGYLLHEDLMPITTDIVHDAIVACNEGL